MNGQQQNTSRYSQARKPATRFSPAGPPKWRFKKFWLYFPILLFLLAVSIRYAQPVFAAAADMLNIVDSSRFGGLCMLALVLIAIVAAVRIGKRM